MDEALKALLDRGRAAEGPLVVLTGAGISAESGIPTFRGEDGYWTVGSRHYQPQEMATQAAYQQMPEEIWRWYLYRRSVCRGAEPNPAHRALVTLEEAYADRFLLITQNVDGLHRRAGNSEERTFCIHGNIDQMRCPEEHPRLRPIPLEIGDDWTADSPFSDEARALLSCCAGQGLSRPHVLWFDEYYDEELFHFESSMRAAVTASLLIVVGTSGSTSLPMQIGSVVAQRGAPMIVLNRDPSPFSEFADRGESGLFVQGQAGDHLPEMVAYLTT